LSAAVGVTKSSKAWQKEHKEYVILIYCVIFEFNLIVFSSCKIFNLLYERFGWMKIGFRYGYQSNQLFGLSGSEG